MIDMDLPSIRIDPDGSHYEQRRKDPTARLDGRLFKYMSVNLAHQRTRAAMNVHTRSYKTVQMYV